jgi:hypothetical protein
MRTPTLLLREARSAKEGHDMMDTLLSAPMGLLSGLEVQSEISELLDEVYGGLT